MQAAPASALARPIAEVDREEDSLVPGNDIKIAVRSLHNLNARAFARGGVEGRARSPWTGSPLPRTCSRTWWPILPVGAVTTIISLDAVRVAWRNTTMHVENKYTQEEAENIFIAVKGFMKKLASRCDENGDPKV